MKLHELLEYYLNILHFFTLPVQQQQQKKTLRLQLQPKPTLLARARVRMYNLIHKTEQPQFYWLLFWQTDLTKKN